MSLIALFILYAVLEMSGQVYMGWAYVFLPLYLWLIQFVLGLILKNAILKKKPWVAKLIRWTRS